MPCTGTCVRTYFKQFIVSFKKFQNYVLFYQESELEPPQNRPAPKPLPWIFNRLQTFRAEILFHLSIVIFQQRSRYVEYAVYFISGSVFTNIVSTQCLWRIYTQYLWPATDSWVNTALQQVCHSGLTGLETSWDFWLIAEWLCLLPSSAWLKLYLSPLTTNAKIFSDLSETFF